MSIAAVPEAATGPVVYLVEFDGARAEVKAYSYAEAVLKIQRAYPLAHIDRLFVEVAPGWSQ